jgi:hypothetical protein
LHDFSPERLVEVLDRHEVEYLPVGGVAARVYGASREMKDIDCLVRRTRANLDRLAAAMRELHARLRVEGLTDAEAALLPVQIDAVTLNAIEISTWRTDAGDLDVLVEIPGRDGGRRLYDELAADARDLDYAGIAVRVAGLDDIIASKEWANRPKTLRHHRSSTSCETAPHGRPTIAVRRFPSPAPQTRPEGPRSLPGSSAGGRESALPTISAAR